MPRPIWSAKAKNLAKRLDDYVVNGVGSSRHVTYKYRLKYPEVPGITYSILPGLLDRYGVHMNSWGYQVFTSNVGLCGE